MAIKGKIKGYARLKGLGNDCPKCKEQMQRRERVVFPTHTYYFTEWDYCLSCGHLQHYEEFKKYPDRP